MPFALNPLVPPTITPLLIVNTFAESVNAGLSLTVTFAAGVFVLSGYVTPLEPPTTILIIKPPVVSEQPQQLHTLQLLLASIQH